MSSEHRQSSFEKYGCLACSTIGKAGDRHDPECPKFSMPQEIEIGKVVYFAHPLRGATVEETQANRKAASALVARFVAKYHVAPVCAWIHLADEWTEAEGRALGLKIDCRLIEAVGLVRGEFWIIGPDRTLSEGMRIEETRARMCGLPIVDRRGQIP